MIQKGDWVVIRGFDQSLYNKEGLVVEVHMVYEWPGSSCRCLIQIEGWEAWEGPTLVHSDYLTVLGHPNPVAELGEDYFA